MNKYTNFKTRAFKKYLFISLNKTITYLTLMLNSQLNPNKMCIRAAPYLHQKSANKALNIMHAFIEVFVLMLLCKFVIYSTYRRYSKS